MKNFILMLVVILALACQATANTVIENHQQSVVSAFLTEPYIAALFSLIVLIATMIWESSLWILSKSILTLQSSDLKFELFLLLDLMVNVYQQIYS